MAVCCAINLFSGVYLVETASNFVLESSGAFLVDPGRGERQAFWIPGVPESVTSLGLKVLVPLDS